MMLSENGRRNLEKYQGNLNVDKQAMESDGFL